MEGEAKKLEFGQRLKTTEGEVGERGGLLITAWQFVTLRTWRASA